MQTLLIVEDDAGIAAGLEYSLTQEGFGVVRCANRKGALEQLAARRFDLAVLDLSLPDGDGFSICRAAPGLLLVDVQLAEGSGFGVCAYARSRGLPVIFLTASGDESSVVLGLDMGADDYIAKPFRPRELVSRIRSVLRRTAKTAGGTGIYEYGDVRVNTAAASVTKGGRDVFLTALEYRLLLTLINHEGQVLSRTQLLEGIWDVSGDFVNDNTLTVYIKRLREKIEDDPQNPAIIKTVRGLGYKI